MENSDAARVNVHILILWWFCDNATSIKNNVIWQFVWFCFGFRCSVRCFLLYFVKFFKEYADFALKMFQIAWKLSFELFIVCRIEIQRSFFRNSHIWANASDVVPLSLVRTKQLKIQSNIGTKTHQDSILFGNSFNHSI